MLECFQRDTEGSVKTAVNHQPKNSTPRSMTTKTKNLLGLIALVGILLIVTVWRWPSEESDTPTPGTRTNLAARTSGVATNDTNGFPRFTAPRKNGSNGLAESNALATTMGTTNPQVASSTRITTDHIVGTPPSPVKKADTAGDTNAPPLLATSSTRGAAMSPGIPKIDTDGLLLEPPIREPEPDALANSSSQKALEGIREAQRVEREAFEKRIQDIESEREKERGNMKAQLEDAVRQGAEEARKQLAMQTNASSPSAPSPDVVRQRREAQALGKRILELEEQLKVLATQPAAPQVPVGMTNQAVVQAQASTNAPGNSAVAVAVATPPPAPTPSSAPTGITQADLDATMTRMMAAFKTNQLAQAAASANTPPAPTVGNAPVGTTSPPAAPAASPVTPVAPPDTRFVRMPETNRIIVDANWKTSSGDGAYREAITVEAGTLGAQQLVPQVPTVVALVNALKEQRVAIQQQQPIATAAISVGAQAQGGISTSLQPQAQAGNAPVAPATAATTRPPEEPQNPVLLQDGRVVQMDGQWLYGRNGEPIFLPANPAETRNEGNASASATVTAGGRTRAGYKPAFVPRGGTGRRFEFNR